MPRLLFKNKKFHRTEEKNAPNQKALSFSTKN